MRQRSGSVVFRSTETIGLAPERIARLGLGYCPEERAIFSNLSVDENLLLPPVLFPGGFTLEDIHRGFPRLKERKHSRGNQLSGGEQQMLAIARLLRTGARFVMFDEPSEGLAPVIVDQIGDMLGELKANGYTILLVEQNFDFAARFSDRFLLVESGRVQREFTADEARREPDSIYHHLGV